MITAFASNEGWLVWPEVSLLGTDWIDGARGFSVTTGRIVLLFSIARVFLGEESRLKILSADGTVFDSKSYSCGCAAVSWAVESKRVGADAIP
jgi:hypothetical protein